MPISTAQHSPAPALSDQFSTTQRPAELLIVTGVLLIATRWATSAVADVPAASLHQWWQLALLLVGVSGYAVVLAWLTAGRRFLHQLAIALGCHLLLTLTLPPGGPAALPPAQLGLTLVLASAVTLTVIAVAGRPRIVSQQSSVNSQI